jgi:membrane carboxypeptidase/penicillin-binding protein
MKLDIANFIESLMRGLSRLGRMFRRLGDIKLPNLRLKRPNLTGLRAWIPTRHNWWVFALIGGGGVIVTGALGAAIWLFVIISDLPDYQSLARYEPPVTTRVYAADGTLIGEYARERRLYVPIGSIPFLVRGAFLSAEDKNFYTHPGVDLSSIIRALITNIANAGSGRRPEGASTITQQVAKNFLLSSEVSYTRKIREAVLAMRIDKAFSKNQILELYLNQIFLGQNSYGVASAALNYFGKSLNELSIAEVAFLAALPKAPSNYHPVRFKQSAIERRNWVIDQMAENGYITDDAAETAKSEDLVTKTRAFGAQTPRRLFRRGSPSHPLHEVWRTAAVRRRPAGSLHAGSQASGHRGEIPAQRSDRL